jgi:hypothetical protein
MVLTLYAIFGRIKIYNHNLYFTAAYAFAYLYLLIYWKTTNRHKSIIYIYFMERREEPLGNALKRDQNIKFTRGTDMKKISIYFAVGFLAIISILKFGSVFASSLEMDSMVISMSVDGTPCAEGLKVQLIAGQVFHFEALIRNAGSAAWGYSDGERGAVLISREPDYNDQFGTFFISPGREQTTPSGKSGKYESYLRAPYAPGEYTMTWQMKDWDIPSTEKYKEAQFFGEALTLEVVVSQREDGAIEEAAHAPNALDVSDFAYEGSFFLPEVPVADDEKAHLESGITLHKVDGEKRLMLLTGAKEQTLYEVSIPELRKIDGTGFNFVQTATLSFYYGVLSGGAIKAEPIDSVGGMWFDHSSDTLYWSRLSPDSSGEADGAPVLYATRIEGALLNPAGNWNYFAEISGPFKGYWGGVTWIPPSFSKMYAEGRTLGLGFGGAYPNLFDASPGPALAAAVPPLPSASGEKLDIQEIFYYDSENFSVRDGNYFTNADYWNSQPDFSQGLWSSVDSVGSGVFIDLPDKQGYIAFAKMGLGRIGSDYGGANLFGKYENCWYIYDYQTLGKAALGENSKTSVKPSSFTRVKYPMENNSSKVVGSCFDAESRRLYLYALYSTPGVNSQPMVHVYRVIEDAMKHPIEITEEMLAEVFGGYGSSAEGSFELHDENGTLLKSIASVKDGKIYFGDYPEGIYMIVRSIKGNAGQAQPLSFIAATINKDGEVAYLENAVLENANESSSLIEATPLPLTPSPNADAPVATLQPDEENAAGQAAAAEASEQPGEQDEAPTQDAISEGPKESSDPSPTKEPTKAPAKVPTKAPAKAPTKAPTPTSTTAPVKTKEPAPAKTSAPTPTPTKTPAAAKAEAPAATTTPPKATSPAKTSAPARSPTPTMVRSAVPTAKPADSYTVRYEGNGNTAGKAPANQTFNLGESVTLSYPGNLARTPISADGKRNTYKFIGWSVNINGKWVTYSPGEKVKFSGNVMLYATWERTS